MKTALPLIVAALLFTIATPARCEPPESAAALFSPMKQRVEQQCASYEQRAGDAANEFQRDEARQGMAMFCDCLPRELDRLERNYDGSNVPRYIAQKGIKAAVAVCGARQVRQQIHAGCERGAKADAIADVAAYCSCMQKGVDQLSDADLAQSAKDENDNFNERVRADLAKQPPAERKTSAMARIDQSCRAH